MSTEAAFQQTGSVFGFAVAWGHHYRKAPFKNCSLQIVREPVSAAESGLQTCVRPPGGYKFSRKSFPFSDKSGSVLCFSLQHRDLFLIHFYSIFRGLQDFTLIQSLLLNFPVCRGHRLCRRFLRPGVVSRPEAPGHRVRDGVSSALLWSSLPMAPASAFLSSLIRNTF